jgi:hypothetical protein
MKNRIVVGIIIIVSAAIAIGFACDNRNSVNHSQTQASFTVDMTVIRDYSMRRNQAQISLKRNNVAYDDADIKIGSTMIPSVGSGQYHEESPLLNLVSGGNQITFTSTNDSYNKIISFDLPDSFGITTVVPRVNQGGVDVQVGWSASAHATKYILVVVGKSWPATNTEPLKLLLASGGNSYVVPDTTFENPAGFSIPDVYYVYLVAYNQGFGEYDGLRFPLPQGLADRRLTDPAGYIRYGTIAPVDSIIILP